MEQLDKFEFGLNDLNDRSIFNTEETNKKFKEVSVEKTLNCQIQSYNEYSQNIVKEIQNNNFEKYAPKFFAKTNLIKLVGEGSECKIVDKSNIEANDENNFKDINIQTQENANKVEFLSKITNCTTISLGEALYNYLYNKHNHKTNEEDVCGICLESLFGEIKLNEIKVETISQEDLLKYFIDYFIVIKPNSCTNHFFHTNCLFKLTENKQYIKCPICSKIYGIMTGDQPKGTMIGKIINSRCSGYSCPTIEIIYNFPDGVGPNKQKYTGTTRNCYLPLCEEGVEVCGLLIESFKRKLTFTVGTSLTTGKTNTTIWNGIHHKTNLYGGSQNFGFPDQTYFLRVTQELAAKGVLKDKISKPLSSLVEEFLGIRLIN
jgi:hypothetical protein